MGLLDKAKEAAIQAKASAQQMAQQGQAKVASAQHGRSEGDLYRALGEAVFNEQRRGGDHDAVVAALAAIDAHLAAPAAQPAGATTPADGATAAPAPAPGAPSTDAPAGNFTLDDL